MTRTEAAMAATAMGMMWGLAYLLTCFTEAGGAIYMLAISQAWLALGLVLFLERR